MSTTKVVDLFIKNLENSFVEDFDRMDHAKEIINEYLRSINFRYEYDYNTFCKELKNSLTETLTLLDESVFPFLDITSFIHENIQRMISRKIIEHEEEYLKDVNISMLINELKNNIENKQK